MNKRIRLCVCLVALASGMIACGSDSPSTPSAPPIPNYGGVWSGTYVISGCNQSGGVALANICGILGNSAPYGFNLTESSRNVTGSFTLGTISFPSTGGTIGSDGSLPLSATSISNGITIVVTWALNLPTTALTGTITQVWQSTTLSGQANVVGTISTANRLASAAPPITQQPMSLQEFLRAVKTQ